MLKQLIKRALNAGVTEGLTFHLEQDDGVGMLIVPNPVLTRQQLNTVSVSRRAPPLRKASGEWKARPFYKAA